jgi:His/Glu/Gln/Arg/opine family amino acid ABC transporter permease subunit
MSIPTEFAQEPELAPEPPPKGVRVWMRDNLFSTPLNAVLTVLSTFVVLAFIRGMLGFVFSEGRQWDAVATNMRLYFTQAYPEDEYLRVWISLGIVFILAGLTVAFWRFDGRMQLRKVTKALMSTGGGVALAFLLAPVAWSTRIWALLIAAILFGAGYLINQSLGERVKEIAVPTLAVVGSIAAAVIVALWVVPIGQYTFDGTANPPNSYEPGTISLSTKLPWTILVGVLALSYGLGVSLRDRVKERAARSTLVGLWLLSFPVIILAILRNPSWDLDAIVERDLPLFGIYAVFGGLLIAFLSNPKLGEMGRLIAGGVLLVAIVAWTPWILEQIPFVEPHPIIKVRLLLFLLAIFSLAAPTFAGDRDSRRRYVITWVAAVALLLFFTALADTASALEIQTKFLGGLALTFTLAIAGITISFPIGVIMALGRTSTMPIFRVLSTIYIEVVRGIPFITVLIFSDIILNLFLPEGLQFDDIVQAIAATAFFSGAYLAENVRGGLQSVRKGQYEAANALGMTTLQLTTLIVLPQALRAVIPALVGQTIAIFKDTSLVTIIGLFDFLYIGSVLVSKQVAFLGSRRESILFVALGYWVFTFAFSRASLRLEKKLGLGER